MVQIMINSSALFSITTGYPSWALSLEAVTVRRTDETPICPLSNGGQHQLTPNTSSSMQSCPTHQIIQDHCTQGHINLMGKWEHPKPLFLVEYHVFI